MKRGAAASEPREPLGFAVHAPTRSETAVLVEIPHAGLEVPASVRPALLVDDATLLRDADLYVDRLWERAPAHGATVLAATVSRYVVDLNRAPDDVDRDTVPDHPAPRPTQSRGVVWRVTTDGRPALRGAMPYRELARRIDAWHAPYHSMLEELLAKKRARFGHVIAVAAHSMPSKARDGARRADVVPGTRGRTSADPAVIDVVDRHFRAAGLSVRHDDPYRGGWSTTRYGRPAEGVHFVQIELSRALYVDEATSTPNEGAMRRLSVLLGELVDALGELRLS